MKKDPTFIRSLKGWLSGNAGLKEERELQQLAQDDPFLADALGGYQDTPEENHELRLQRIRKRLTARPARSKGFPIWLRVAAGGALLIAALFTLRWVNDTGTDRIGQQSPAAIEEIQKEDAPAASMQEAEVATEQTEERTTAVPPSPAAADAEIEVVESKPQIAREATPSRPKPVISEERKDDPKIASQDQPAAGLALQEETIEATPKVQEPSAAEKQAPTQSSRSALAIKKEKPVRSEDFSDRGEKEAEEEALSDNYSPPPSPSGIRPPERNISGIVTDPNGQPLIGVAVKIPGTQQGTLTDRNGKYQLPLNTDPQQIEFDYVGFQSRRIPVEQLDTYNIQLMPAAETLSEIVLSNNDTRKARKRDQTTTIAQVTLKATGLKDINSQGAVPAGGLQKINRVIRRKASKIEATYTQVGQSVGLSFRVAPGNIVEEVKVVDSQGAVLDLEAIRLIKLTNWQLQSGYEKTGAMVYCKLQF